MQNARFLGKHLVDAASALAAAQHQQEALFFGKSQSGAQFLSGASVQRTHRISRDFGTLGGKACAGSRGTGEDAAGAVAEQAVGQARMGIGLQKPKGKASKRSGKASGKRHVATGSKDAGDAFAAQKLAGGSERPQQVNRNGQVTPFSRTLEGHRGNGHEGNAIAFGQALFQGVAPSEQHRLETVFL